MDNNMSLLPEEILSYSGNKQKKNGEQAASPPLPPHVVMVPNPAPGHGRPFLQAARQLIDAGIAVTYVSTDGYIPQLLKSAEAQDARSRGVRFAKLGDGTAHLTEPDFFQFMISDEGSNKLASLLEQVICIAPDADDLALHDIHVNSGRSHFPRPSCILHDMFTTWTHQVAEKMNIAHHLLFTSPATILAFIIELPRLCRDGIVPVTPENRDTVVTYLPGMARLPAHEIPGALHLGSPICDDIMEANAQYVHCSHILVNTFHALESNVLEHLRKTFIGAPNVKTEAILEIGPMLLAAHGQGDEGTKEKDPCIEWLDTQAPSSVLYISFGTLAALSAPQILAMAQGLEASNQPFLWVLRPPSVPFLTAWNQFGSLPDVISDFLPPGFEERTQGRGMCVSCWVPQREILHHPATGGFLSHCGWNSALEAICAGIPFLAWPMVAEQGLNCRFLVDTVKVSIEVKKGEDGLVSKEEVEQKVQALMQEVEGQTVKDKIGEMSAGAKQAVAEGGTSNQNFRAYIHLLQTGTLLHSTA